MHIRSLSTITAAMTLAGGISQGYAQTPAQLEIFEKNARPVFVEKCQACHNAKLKSGGLDLSSPDGLRQAAAGGFFGSAVPLSQCA